jgi:hypothetical protein
VQTPLDDVSELVCVGEVSDVCFAASFQEFSSKLTIETLLTLAEERINSRLENIGIPQDISSIPGLIRELDSDSTNKVEINLVELIKQSPRHITKLSLPLPRNAFRSLSKIKPSPREVKRLQIDLRGRTKRKGIL